MDGADSKLTPGDFYRNKHFAASVGFWLSSVTYARVVDVGAFETGLVNQDFRGLSVILRLFSAQEFIASLQIEPTRRDSTNASPSA